MLVHDVAIDKLHVVFGVDRAGLVGEDGETHHGVMDVAYLDSVPGMTVLAPSGFAELESMLEYAVKDVDGPVAIRYPRGAEGSYRGNWNGCDMSVLKDGKDITLVTYGMEINDVLESAEHLEKQNISAEVIKVNVLTPLNVDLLLKSVQKTGALLIAEDSIDSGSIGQRIYAAMQQEGIRAKTDRVNCGNQFVTHGSLRCLKKELYLDGEGIAKKAMEVLGHG
jgi:1-deoxy-D-xylulose-5-phosphate synthase